MATITPTDLARRVLTALAPPEAPTLLWGLDPIALHDRVWAARSVLVVRPGQADIPERGPGLYLLLGPDQMLDVSIAQARDELLGARVEALHVRVVGPRPRRHDEIVRTDADGGFLAVERVYSPGPNRSASCWVTASPDIATAWAGYHGPARSRRLKARIRRGRTGTLKLPGTILDPADHDAVSRWLCEAAERVGRLSAVLPSVYHYHDDVWAHETARIGPGVRFAGPALIGAGVEIPAGATVIGPVVLEDAAPTPPPKPVEWEVLGAPMWRIVPTGRPGSLYVATKRLFDIAFSLCVLAGVAIIAPLVMLLIYLEDGRPFFFAHTRQTLGGREFPCWKFRTMVKDADKRKTELALANQADGPQFYIKNDPRLLRVGRWLRRFQIDELPQFWNVLVGHMSVVGPRPSPDRENQFCPAWRDARLSVRPGITGLWQVRRTRAPDTDFQEWIRYDLEYVQRRSWSLDLWILVLTIRRVIFNG